MIKVILLRLSIVMKVMKISTTAIHQIQSGRSDKYIENRFFGNQITSCAYVIIKVFENFRVI